MTTALKNEIKSFVRESVREVLFAEMANIRGTFISRISPNEQKSIERIYKKPSHIASRKISIKI